MGKLSRTILAAQLVVSPLLLGSNRAIFWALNGALTAAALFFFVLSEMKKESPSSVNSKYSLFIFILLFAPALWMIVQLVPGIPKALAHPVWDAVPSAEARITIDPRQTLLALLWWLTLVNIFVAIKASMRRGGANVVLSTMMYTVVSVAVFGLANLYFGWNTLGITQKFAYQNWLTGTFVNRNTAASFFVIGLSIASGLGFQTYSRIRREPNNDSVIGNVLSVFDSRVPLYVSVALIILAALLLTGSRAGIASAFAAVTTTAVLHLRGRLHSRYIYGTVIAAFILSIAGFNILSDRSRDAADSTLTRINLAHEAISAIEHRPLLGHGAGAYQSVEPLFHEYGTPSDMVWNHAHNSYLEAAATLGLPLTIAWLAVFILLLAKLFRTHLRSEKPMISTIVLISVSCAEGLHALVDFSMQTQAVAIYFACILGLSIGEAVTSEARRHTKTLRSEPARSANLGYQRPEFLR